MWTRIILICCLSWTAAKGQLTLAADSTAGFVGDKVEVSIRAVQWQSIVSAQGTVEWDTAVMALDSISQLGLPGMNVSNFGQSLVAGGKLTFSWNEPNLQATNLPDSTAIFTLRFLLTGLPGAASPVELVSDPTTLEFVDDNFSTVNFGVVPGQVMITDTTATGIWADAFNVDPLRIGPNPITDQSVVSWEAAATEMTWRLWSVEQQMVAGGTEVWRQARGQVGWRELVENKPVAGVYWLNVMVNGREVGKKIVIE